MRARKVGILIKTWQAPSASRCFLIAVDMSGTRWRRWSVDIQRKYFEKSIIDVSRASGLSLSPSETSTKAEDDICLTARESLLARANKLQTIGEDFCGLDVNTPLGGEDPMEGTPVLTFNTHLTAVAATSTGDYTVVFVGTNEGHLKKRNPASISPQVSHYANNVAREALTLNEANGVSSLRLANFNSFETPRSRKRKLHEHLGRTCSIVGLRPAVRETEARQKPES
ncbi:hypothetical protein K0M31_003803 [Melipona bicolor]|uniref:Sema domain-containing protein n=1 Tax=Melipona bicolor TaxID=60889 RepID=A0AA40KNU1_9HYME|nr:hypothetical protein K0M31_003803 [Melipona bicolor]